MSLFPCKSTYLLPNKILCHCTPYFNVLNFKSMCCKVLVLVGCNVNGTKPNLKLKQIPILLEVLKHRLYEYRKPFSKLHLRFYQPQFKMVINFVTICINMILGIKTVVKLIDWSSTWGLLNSIHLPLKNMKLNYKI